MAKFKITREVPAPVATAAPAIVHPPGTLRMRYPDEIASFTTSTGNVYVPDSNGFVFIRPEDVANARRSGFVEA